MKTTHTLRKTKQLTIATIIACGYLADDAAAQQQIRRISPAAPAWAAPVIPASPAAHAVARSIAPAPPPPPAPGGQAAANGKMVSPSSSSSHGKAINRNFVATPTGLTNTLDSKVCTQHAGIAGGLGCTAGLPNGMLALVWNCPNLPGRWVPPLSRRWHPT